MKQRRQKILGILPKTLLAALSLAALASCYSVFDAAVDSMIDREAEKAVAEADAAESSAASAQKAPQNIDPSVHRIAGPWVNPDYDDEGRAARVVYSLNVDGTFTYLAFDRLEGSGEVHEGTVTYIRTWVDKEGRSCGESTVTLNNGMSWDSLDRISVDGNTLEVQSGVRAIDPKGPPYSVYYRP